MRGDFVAPSGGYMTAQLPQLRAPSRARLVDDVRQSLEEAILTGKIPPGERLRETWIAEQLTVSRTTVREALLMLERQGLVVTKPRRGTFVTRLSRQDALDVGFSRALLEAYAVRVGFAKIDKTILNRLDSLIGAMAACRLPDDVPRLVQLDTEFHHLLVETAGSRRIVELWESLSGQIRALYITTLETEHATIEYVVNFHRLLVDALRTGDPVRVQEAIVRHYVRAAPSEAAQVAAISDVLGVIAPAFLVHAGAMGPLNEA
jgi:DNA-binding GntR family transcriptional regulator